MGKSIEEVQSQEQAESSPEIPFSVPDAQFIDICTLLLIRVNLDIPIFHPENSSRRVECRLVVELEMNHFHSTTSDLIKDLEVK